MDFGLLAALALLVIWAVGTFAFGAPGWIHLLLTVGVFLLIYRIVARATPGGTTPAARPDDSSPTRDAR